MNASAAAHGQRLSQLYGQLQPTTRFGWLLLSQQKRQSKKLRKRRTKAMMKAVTVCRITEVEYRREWSGMQNGMENEMLEN